MSGNDNYPFGVTSRDIPGWEGIDIDECREQIAGTSECRNRCEPFQVRECIQARHDDKKCIDECPVCEQEELEAEEEDIKQCYK